jgi:hypothetical protein
MSENRPFSLPAPDPYSPSVHTPPPALTADELRVLLKTFAELAGAVISIAKTMELDYQRRYPAKKPPRDIDITSIKSEEEERRENLGSTGEETTQDWMAIGPREKAFLEYEEREKRLRDGSSAGEGERHSKTTGVRPSDYPDTGER